MATKNIFSLSSSDTLLLSSSDTSLLSPSDTPILSPSGLTGGSIKGDIRINNETMLSGFSGRADACRRMTIGEMSFPRRRESIAAGECGRSMTEMLGALAIIGVLSVGAVGGYSYAMDKYRANTIMNDVNLRAVDLIAQALRGGDLSLTEWSAKTAGDCDIGLEKDASTSKNTGGISVFDVKQRVCEIIADDLLPEDVKLVIDGENYTKGKCGETNKMVFYYDNIGDALTGEPNDGCDGVMLEGVCMDCPENATVSADGFSCECAEGFGWNYTNNTCEEQEYCESRLEPYIQGDSNLKGNVVIDLSGYDLDLSNECSIKVNSTLIIKNGTLSNIETIEGKSATSHGIVLDNARLENIGQIIAETRGSNSYALYMNSSNLQGYISQLEITANGSNGGALYMNNSSIDLPENAGITTIRMKENVGNQVVVGQGSKITGITLMPESLPIPETDGIILGDIY